jgi:hypothetical protein
LAQPSGGLHPGGQDPTCSHKGRYGPDTGLDTFLFIGQDRGGIISTLQGKTQGYSITFQVGRQRTQDSNVADILAVFEKSPENGTMVLLETPLVLGPLGRLVGQPGAGLYRGPFHGHLHLCRQRVDVVLPGTDQVITVGLQERDRLGPELKGAPTDPDAMVSF